MVALKNPARQFFGNNTAFSPSWIRNRLPKRYPSTQSVMLRQTWPINALSGLGVMPVWSTFTNDLIRTRIHQPCHVLKGFKFNKLTEISTTGKPVSRKFGEN